MTGVKVFDGVASVASGDVLLTLWRTPARCERIRVVTAWTEELLGATDGTIAAAQFLLPSASPPDGPARAEAMVGLRIVAPRARRLITVPLGDALWHDVVRTIIRGAVKVWGRSKLIKVASSSAQALDLIAEVATPRSPARGDLEVALTSLYRALDVTPPRGLSLPPEPVTDAS